MREAPAAATDTFRWVTLEIARVVADDSVSDDADDEEEGAAVMVYTKSDWKCTKYSSECVPAVMAIES